MKLLALSAAISSLALPALAHDGLHMHPHGFESAIVAALVFALVALGTALFRRG